MEITPKLPHPCPGPVPELLASVSRACPIGAFRSRVCDTVQTVAPPRYLPPVQEIQKLLDGGMTQAQVAEHLTKTTGHKITRSAISVALVRAGVTKPLPRYKEELPWKVAQSHLRAYPARMLRLLGRANRGGRLSLDDSERLTSWLTSLAEDNVVVAYSPTAGFLYVPADEVGDGENGIPIRHRTITDDELPDANG